MRQFNKPWKRIYGVDRGYTARVDRLRERQADTAAMTVEIARYSTVPSDEFVTLTDFMKSYEPVTEENA